MNEVGMNELLSQLRVLSAQAQGRPPAADAVAPVADANSFQSLLKSSIDGVNNVQQQAGTLMNAFEAGEPGTDLAGVMVAMQKASLSFQAMVQVRNKLVSAYQEIMSMQV